MHSRGDHWSPAKKIKVTLCLSYFCVTKRRVQGGEATSERRRRDGVYQKSSKRAFTPVSTTRFYCMIIAKTNPISLCSLPDTHHNINREVRHSLTCHSSKSESARGAFRTCSHGNATVGRFTRYVRTGGRWLFAESKAGRCREVF